MSTKKRTPDNETSAATTAVADAPAVEPQVETPPEAPSFADRVGQRKPISIPDPFGIATDALAGVRLFESKRDGQMAMRFDKKPGPAVLGLMHDAKWKWKPADGIWAYPVTSDSAMRTRIDAELLFQEVRQLVRQEKGIGPAQDIPF